MIELFFEIKEKIDKSLISDCNWEIGAKKAYCGMISSCTVEES